MGVRQSYNLWSSQYDTNENKTRDLEARALREILSRISFTHCLELGCGTGKNTEWLHRNAYRVLAVDLSEEMIGKAKEKINSGAVEFLLADISKAWAFPIKQFDLITFSLVLEHIEDLNHIFHEASRTIKDGGHLYVGELHPFKQYAGSKARFETPEGLHVVECYTHHISDFMTAATNNGFTLERLYEYFDEDDKQGVPRLLTLLFRKKVRSF